MKGLIYDPEEPNRMPELPSHYSLTIYFQANLMTDQSEHKYLDSSSYPWLYS